MPVPVPYLDVMPNATKNPTTYELCYDPSDADMLIYKSVHAGVCGPHSESIPCDSREAAERIAFNMGYLISSEWQSHTNYDSADLTRMS